MTSPDTMIRVGMILICCGIVGSMMADGRIHIMMAPNVVDINLITIMGVLICFHSFIMKLDLNDRGPHTVAIDMRIEYSAVNLIEKKIRNSINMLFELNEALSTIMSLE